MAIFEEVRAYFSIGGTIYHSDPVSFNPLPDEIFEVTFYDKDDDEYDNDYDDEDDEDDEKLEYMMRTMMMTMMWRSVWGWG